jgi:siroheme synthase
MSTVVVYMGLRHVSKIAARLIDAGMAADLPAAAIAHATLPNQIVVDSTLSQLARDAEEADLQAPAILVIGENARLHRPLPARRAHAGAKA